MHFSGISGKSQILFATVFTTRYLDLLTSFISLYNTCMKVRGLIKYITGPRRDVYRLVLRLDGVVSKTHFRKTVAIGRWPLNLI